MKDSEAGFTLLELGVVIAILGLLAGGILAGQSYIRNSKMTTLVNEAKFYQNQVITFEDKYGAPPGDLARATQIWGTASCPPAPGNTLTGGTCDGDGSGFIYYPVALNTEPFLAFHHLLLAGLITGKYSGAAGAGGATEAIPGTNIPLSPFPDVGYMLNDALGTTVTGGTFPDGSYYHTMFVGSYIAGNWPRAPFLTTAEMLKLDTKYDDGSPATGSIRIRKGLPNCTDAAGTTYLATTTKSCWFVYTAP